MGSQDLGVGLIRYIIEETMENIESATNDVDILPIKELSMTLWILRRLTAASLRAASEVLDNLARSLDVTEDSTEILKTSSDIQEEQAFFQLEKEEVSTRHRKDTLDSSDSGYEDDCGFSCNIDLESGLEVISLEEVSYHCTMEDGWMVIFDKVYNVTEYLESDKHPGGLDVMMDYLGYDATMAFRGVGHSKGALKTLEKYLVGILPTEERLNFISL